MTDQPDWLSVENGIVSWTDSCVASTQIFKVKCETTINGNLISGESEQVTLIITSEEPTPAINIIVSGSSQISGVGGYSGYSDYSANDNLGHALNGVIWSVDGGATATGINIYGLNNSGILSWLSTATSGNFTIRCHKDGLSDGTINVRLNITNPTPNRLYHYQYYIETGASIVDANIHANAWLPINENSLTIELWRNLVIHSYNGQPLYDVSGRVGGVNPWTPKYLSTIEGQNGNGGVSSSDYPNFTTGWVDLGYMNIGIRKIN